MTQTLTNLPNDFQPYQMLYLEHEWTRLYAEVIQVVTKRRFCWVRPLMLVTLPKDGPLNQWNLSIEQATLFDLRQGSDLLWPTALFQIALDVEVIPLLTHLNDTKTYLEGDRLAHQQMRDFIHCVWKSYPNAF